MIKPQVYSDYRYQFSKQWNVEDLPIGCLISACFYHFNLEMTDKIYDIGAVEVFKFEEIISFKVRSKCFGYSKHRIRNLINRFEEYKQNGDYSKALNCLDIKQLLEDGLMREQDFLDSLAEKADIFFLKGSLNEAIETCLKALKRLTTNSPT